MHDSRGSFHFSIFIRFPSGKFFRLISRSKISRWKLTVFYTPDGINSGYTPSHPSIELFIVPFEFCFSISPLPLPRPPRFIPFPPFNHRIGWARFCEKSLKSRAPHRKSAEGIIFFSRKIVNKHLSTKKFFSLSLSLNCPDLNMNSENIDYSTKIRTKIGKSEKIICSKTISFDAKNIG